MDLCIQNDCKEVRDVCTGNEMVEEKDLKNLTVNDLSVVKAQRKSKKKGKSTANCVIVGADDVSFAGSCDFYKPYIFRNEQGRDCNFNGRCEQLSVDCDAKEVLNFEEIRQCDSPHINSVSNSSFSSDPGFVLCTDDGLSCQMEDSTSDTHLCLAPNKISCDTEDSIAYVSPTEKIPEMTADCTTLADENSIALNCKDSSIFYSYCTRNRFSMSEIEDEAYECTKDFDDSSMRDKNVTVDLGKRSRLISTDSSSSVSEVKKKSKASKKLKYKGSAKKEEDDEIERILAGLESSSKKEVPVKEIKVNANSIETLPVSEENLQTSENAKKKKKKKKPVKQTPSEDNVVDCLTSVSGGELVLEAHADELTSTKSSKEIVLGTDAAGLENAKTKIKGEDLKDRKKPGKKQLALIQAALRRAEEEEERLRQEELARQKKAEEAEKLRLEKLRLEEEKKEKKKQKIKDKKQRLKAEGKLLTKSQKVARARAEATLSAWREHGIDVPQVGEKKSVSDVKVIPRKKSTVVRSETEDEFPSLHSESSSKTSLLSSSTETDDQVPINWELLDDGKSEHELERCEGKHRHSSGSNFGVSCVRTVVSETSFHLPKYENKSRLRARSESDICHGIKRKDRTLTLEQCNEVRKSEFHTQLRSPVVCVLGHVDTGKTKILDKIRKTHVQDDEAGGITQQIGATLVPREAIKEKCGMVKAFSDFELKLPGLLIIDTPGHESFRNLRSRGSSLCDIAILVVDIMHGLEQQTIESIGLLKDRKTPFVVALNKVDRLYGWKSDPNDDIEDVIKRQDLSVCMELDKRYKQIIVEFAKQSLNATLYYENTDPRSYVSLVPVSAISGDGMGNLLAVVSQLCQTMMPKKLTFSEELQASVLEVKITAGLGTTIDVILVNGTLRESDTIVLAGHDGPLVTQIRSILMPQPLKELRVKNPYQEYKSIKGSHGIKIAGKDLDKAIAGLPLFVADRPDDVHILKDKMTRLYRTAMSAIRVSGEGVYVQASTLGSLEALLDFLKSSQIPYAGVKVGPVVKKDVIKASVMLEHDIQYAVILAFDVKIEREAQELADHLGIKIFHADIIYKLFDSFIEFREELREKKKNELKKLCVFPCKLNVLPNFIFNERDPIVIGVQVTAGALKLGTPLCVPSRNFVDLGVVSSIEVNHQPLQSAKEGDAVCIKIENSGDDAPKAYGRHFDSTDILVSKISRESIDVCKEFYRDDLKKSDWQLMVELKKLFLIV